MENLALIVASEEFPFLELHAVGCVTRWKSQRAVVMED